MSEIHPMSWRTSSGFSRGAHLVVRLPSRAVVALLRLYQRVVSPLYGTTCRFYPSCSQYALLSVQRHGVFRGTRLAVWRLLRCNPWNPGGVDDVPPGKESPHAAHDE
ncbi:MAG: membrane protein insertion efficiency factor YidD [Cellulomonas sp.]